MPLATTSALLQEISFNVAPHVLDLALSGSKSLRFTALQTESRYQIHLDLIYTPVACSANVFLIHIKKRSEENSGPSVGDYNCV